MAVALDDHEVVHLHTAEIAGAADVVAREVHEHEVFGAFLRIGEQVLRVGFIFLGVVAALARAGDGADLDFSIDRAHMHLRAAADERKGAPDRGAAGNFMQNM